MFNLISTAIPLVGSFLISRNERNQAQQIMQEQQQQYEKELLKLNGLFNRNYYTNMLDRSDVRGLLSDMREQMTQSTQDLKNQASITGATPETITATQKAQNQAYGKAVSQVASYATNWKENTLRNYLTARNALEEYYQPAKSNYMNHILGNSFSSTLNTLRSMFN